MKQDAILFLFNLTDIAPQPWLDAGYMCIAVDTQHSWGWHWRDWNYATTNHPVGSSELALALEPYNIKFVVGFPPCTVLASCGAGTKRTEKEIQDAVDLATHCTTYDAPYIVENPVGRLSTWWRKPDVYVHPWEFGGWLEAHESQHPEWPEYIAAYDAYPKKTGLWVGGGANLPIKKPVAEPTGYSTQYNKLGGRSLKTKNIRSATPRGLARAIYEANGPYTEWDLCGAWSEKMYKGKKV